MFTVYLVCLITGGTFLAGSAIFGGKDAEDGGGDLTHDHDLDSHDALVLHEGNQEAGHVEGDGSLLTPFLSLRFWTFFLSFFGLTGVALSGLGLWGSSLLIGAASLGMGLVSGYGVSYTFSRLRNQIVDSSLEDRDYLGATGRVLLPIARGQTGKVRLELRGRTLDLMAETDDDQPLELRQNVFVYGIERGVLKVTNPDLRRLSAPEAPS